MISSKRQLCWVVMHSLAILAILTSLLTGLRIATVSRPDWLFISALLPQGAMHYWHMLSAALIIAITLSYVVYLVARPRQPNYIFRTKKTKSQQYHKLINYVGYLIISSSIVSGGALTLAGFVTTEWLTILTTLHYYSALAMIAYLILHSWMYWVQYGIAVFKRILTANFRKLRTCSAILLILTLSFFGTQVIMNHHSQQQLLVSEIPISEFIAIDGDFSDPAWQTAKPIAIWTYGGANFVDGATEITVKAVHNQVEAFFAIEWQDPSKSVQHLPLVKTNAGWQVQQDGFHHFDEQTYYEDKFAILLSSSCQFGADNTAHLGPKPLTDKPANWHGKGYHYANDDKIRDLWHWKAVRTNDMVLADDNFIGKPDKERTGKRRYTAGYKADVKESGAYVMNWQWYKPDILVPKRLPIDDKILSAAQNHSINAQDWITPWFGYQPYRAKLDHYPSGTVMPSVLYRSNRFEGDRANVRAKAQWQDGKWRLELVRPLNTQSQFDVAIQPDTCMWFSAFDQSQIAHTRHAHAIQLSLANWRGHHE